MTIFNIYNFIDAINIKITVNVIYIIINILM